MSNKIAPAAGRGHHPSADDGCCGLRRLVLQFVGGASKDSANAENKAVKQESSESIDQDSFRNKLAESRRRSFIDDEKTFQNWEVEQDKVANARARRTSVAECKQLGKLGLHNSTVFDDFKVIRTLGEGGFGKVVLVSKKKPRSDQEEPAQFALKVLNKSFIIESGNVTRAVAEKDILQYIRHPFIVRLYYAFQSPEHLFLCMTYIGGGELYTLMETYVQFRQGGVPPKWAEFYAAEIALALHHLHLHGILYRDLKPENIMLGLDGHVCLTDFGLAMEYDEEEGMNEIAGTPCYICPDVLGDDPPTEGCDWWSYGVIVYELLFGKTPFGQGMTTVEAVFEDIQHGSLLFPPHTPTNTMSFLNGLLDRNTQTRLGKASTQKDNRQNNSNDNSNTSNTSNSNNNPNNKNNDGGFKTIEEHPFFKQYDFGKMLRKEVAAPYIPMEMQVKHKVDVTSIVLEKPKKKK